jgi:hypothetical protein
VTTQQQINELVRVWNNPGPHSVHQRGIRERIVAEWPALGTAIANIEARPEIPGAGLKCAVCILASAGDRDAYTVSGGTAVCEEHFDAIDNQPLFDAVYSIEKGSAAS